MPILSSLGSGTINSYGFFKKSFVPIGIQVAKVSIYAVYSGGARACNYDLQWSDDNINWTTSFSGNMYSNTCGIFDGSITSSPSLGKHRYWRYVATTVTDQHHPRYARLFVTDTIGRKFNIEVITSDNCSDIGFIPIMEGSAIRGPLDSLTATPY